jgi:hypothetical protein
MSHRSHIEADDNSAMSWTGDSPGMQAVRHNRYVILPKDFEAGWKDHAPGQTK